jgi:hypothetical protein
MSYTNNILSLTNEKLIENTLSTHLPIINQPEKILFEEVNSQELQQNKLTQSKRTKIIELIQEKKMEEISTLLKKETIQNSTIERSFRSAYATIHAKTHIMNNPGLIPIQAFGSGFAIEWWLVHVPIGMFGFTEKRIFLIWLKMNVNDIPIKGGCNTHYSSLNNIYNLDFIITPNEETSFSKKESMDSSIEEHFIINTVYGGYSSDIQDIYYDWEINQYKYNVESTEFTLVDN